MIVTKIKRKTRVAAVAISKPERYKPIDIRIPSNVTRITGILVTTSAAWRDVGTVTLQAYDSTDIFYMDFVTPDSIALSDEALLNIEDSGFDSDQPWVTGHVPQLKPVQIAGDNVYLKAWFKGGVYREPFMLNIYVEFEAVEEFIGFDSEQMEVAAEPKSYIL
ncbi:MAG TPA: hypothetical protein VIM75_18240 [Ohtaekwangia sp.]|uniref:hypothetical protein n=1 Tax=Ohtaekwangia sp. TaxID=2066019 RepID=UPI002F93D0E7